MLEDCRQLKQALEEERYRSERMEEQINDLTELHQHEVLLLLLACHTYSIAMMSFNVNMRSKVLGVRQPPDPFWIDFNAQSGMY